MGTTILIEKKDLIELIKLSFQEDKNIYKKQCYKITKEFDKVDDFQISEYLMGVISGNNVFETLDVIDNEDKIKEIDKKFVEIISFLEKSMNQLKSDLARNKDYGIKGYEIIMGQPTNTTFLDQLSMYLDLLDRIGIKY